MPEFTARNVAKFVAKAIVTAKATSLAEDAIVNHTEKTEDDLVVDIGSKVIGWYVGAKLEPVTDKIVDTTADFIAAKHANRQARKATKTTESAE